ncbi:MAG: GNAT family N-acetyltransferase [Lachnospiraceae bacterium]|nr:GNAT family N-acetyltransferase [Lachnospiraceae bacterium]
MREFAESDMDDLYALHASMSDAQSVMPLADDPAEEREILREYIRTIYGFYGFGMWAVLEKSTGKLIGKIGLQPECEGVALGYMVHGDYRRRGIAQEVCMAVCTFAKEELEINSILAWIRDDNLPSIALAKKLGFHPTEVMRQKERRYEL